MLGDSHPRDGWLSKYVCGVVNLDGSGQSLVSAGDNELFSMTTSSFHKGSIGVGDLAGGSLTLSLLSFLSLITLFSSTVQRVYGTNI